MPKNDQNLHFCSLPAHLVQDTYLLYNYHYEIVIISSSIIIITCSSIVFRLRALEPDVHFLILTLNLHFHVVYIIIQDFLFYIIIKKNYIIVKDFFLQESETLSKDIKLMILWVSSFAKARIKRKKWMLRIHLWLAALNLLPMEK